MAAPSQGLMDVATSMASLSPPVMLAVALLAFLRGWVVMPREIDRRDAQIAELEKERDEYKIMLFRALDVSERITAAVEERDRK